MGKHSRRQHRWGNHRTRWDRLTVWLYRYCRFRWGQFSSNVLNWRI